VNALHERTHVAANAYLATRKLPTAGEETPAQPSRTRDLVDGSGSVPELQATNAISFLERHLLRK